MSLLNKNTLYMMLQDVQHNTSRYNAISVGEEICYILRKTKFLFWVEDRSLLGQKLWANPTALHYTFQIFILILSNVVHSSCTSLPFPHSTPLRLLRISLSIFLIKSNRGWHKNGTFEKPQKIEEIQEKKNYWQKLNHYNLHFKRQ